MAIVFPTSEPELEPRHQFAKMVLGSTAGFLTDKLIQNIYDILLTKYRNKRNLSIPK